MPTNRTLGRAGQVAIVGLLVVGAIVGLAGRTGYGLLGLLGLLTFFIPFAGVGAILVIRRPQTSIGWILLGLGWAFVVITVNVPGTVEQFADGILDSPAELFAVIHNASIGVLFYLFLLLATVLPSGQLPAGRWGGLTRLALAIGLISAAAGCVMPVINVTVIGYAPSVPVHNPVALLPDLPIWQVITSATVGLPSLAMVVPAAISLVVRSRRSRGIERQQLRWVAASIGFVVLAVVAGFAISSFVPGSDSGIAWTPALVAFPTVPIAVGIAVLRYRLYEIDRIISRTIGWAVVTGTLVAVFGGAVIGLQALLSSVTQGQTLAVAVSTLVAFALFQPVRRRVQSAIDRRFDRGRVNAERTAAAFAERLRDQVDLASLETDIGTTVTLALRPSSTGVWIRGASR